VAAAQCHRQGIAEIRNQQTADLFRQAVGVASNGALAAQP
jgi:hypothetical protein